MINSPYILQTLDNQTTPASHFTPPPKIPPTPPPKPKNIKGFEEFQSNPSSLENPENNYESIKNHHPNLLVNPSSSTV